ncbi:MAG TPA: hypothetical protein PKV03_13090 [Methylotenera sp.]|nr:hypothetical protein [Methylotenera sp.]HPN02358.1 hypothetical protein [Methylotenera sp.]
MATSPTQRSLKYLREQGYTVAITEKWNPHARVRQDLFGFIDMLGIKDGQTLAVQTTSSSSFSERKKKIEAHENLPLVLAAGWQVSVHGWRKNSKGKWVVREGEVEYKI